MVADWIKQEDKQIVKDYIRKIFFNQMENKRGKTMKRSWWKLTIDDNPNLEPNEADLEHIAKCIKEGYHQGELIQEEDNEEREE